jgi:hypothetical protein
MAEAAGDYEREISPAACESVSYFQNFRNLKDVNKVANGRMKHGADFRF